MKPVRTMVLLANEGHARLFENTGPGKGLVELADMKADDLPEFSDTAGRSQSAGNTARHGFDPETGLREQGRAHFADAVVASASEIWSQNGFDRLVISAAPRMLGALRDRLDGPMAKALSADMDKDLLKIPVGDLPAHFADVAAF